MRYQVLTYCAVAYAITWTIAFGIYGFYAKGALTAHELNLYHSCGAIGPTIAAFIATYFFYGTKGLKNLLARLLPRLPNKKTLWLVLSPVVFFGLGILVYRIFKNEWFDFKAFASENWSSTNVTIVWLLPLVTYAFFEEIGWRGFLLPHLQEKYNAWQSTIYLSGIWALWHLPFFFYRFDFSIFISVGFLFGLFVGALILTSIYNSNKGYILPAILFHFLNNLFSGFDKEILVAVLSTGFIFIAINIYKTYGILNLSNNERTKNYFVK